MTEEMKDQEPISCGCGHHHEEGEACCGSHHHEEEWEEIDEEDMVVLTLDDDTELECVILEIFPLDEKSYIALLPVSEEEQAEEEEPRVLLYEYIEGEDEEDINLSMIESEEEFERVAEEFNRLMDEEEQFEEEE